MRPYWKRLLVIDRWLLAGGGGGQAPTLRIGHRYING